jgi:uncharacterized protein with PCYCGC motif
MESERPGSAGPILTLAVAALVVIVAGVGTGIYQAMHHMAPAPTTRAHSQMTDGFSLMDAPAAVRVHYRSAGNHPDTYRQIPCYCGCDSFLAHRNLKDCFVAADGTGWDRHAAGCAVCIEESSIVRRLIARGLSPPAIRDEVIDRYETVV